MLKQMGNVVYDYHDNQDKIESIKINGNEIRSLICCILLRDISISHTNFLPNFPYKIEFSSEIEQICIAIFESIKELKKNKSNEALAAMAATYLFEGFVAQLWSMQS